MVGVGVLTVRAARWPHPAMVAASHLEPLMTDTVVVVALAT